MSQTYTANCYQSDHVAVTDMANIEANFATLRSSNSGSSAPSNTEAGLKWWDTVKNMLKIRNDADTAWLAILQGSASQKLWIYRNDSDDGWAIDTGVTDRVLALKGGTGLYNRTGGGVAGETWSNLKAHTHTGPSHSHSHNHQVYDYNSGSDSEYFNAAGTQVDLPNTGYSSDNQIAVLHGSVSNAYQVGASMYSAIDATAGGTGNTGAQSTADVRPQAAVGTLQYPDI